MISTAISKVDIDIRNPLYKNIFLCGGNSLIKGVPERITNEIKKNAPKHTKVLVYAPAGRKNSCYTGALIISNLGSFKGMWVTKNVKIIKTENFLTKYIILISSRTTKKREIKKFTLKQSKLLNNNFYKISYLFYFYLLNQIPLLPLLIIKISINFLISTSSIIINYLKFFFDSKVTIQQ